MKTLLLLIALLMVNVSSVFGSSELLPRSTPEAQGIPSDAILKVIESAEAKPTNAFHSLIIVRNGHVVAEGYWTPYAADQPHELFSLSKSFTSTAVGLAQAEGLLSIDDPVIGFFPDQAPEDPAEFQQALRIRQLLMMSTGHQKEPDVLHRPQEDKTIVQAFLETVPEFKPGTHFLYNTAATYMQSAIVQQVSGQRVRDYLYPRLFEPLGIELPHWDQCPQGIDFGGYGLRLKTMDIARFGQLLLQKGEWHGKQLVPADWVEEATARQTANGCYPDSDWDQGYGYQFWRNTVGGFRGDGAFGQLCIVIPEKNLVVAATAACRSMQDEMRWLWNHLLPTIQNEPLPENSETHERLAAKLASLTMPMPTGAAVPAAVPSTGNYTFDEENFLQIKRMECLFEEAQSTLKFHHSEGIQEITWKPGEWTRQTLTRSPHEGPIPAFVAGAWTDADTLRLDIIYAGKAQNVWMVCAFEESAVQLDIDLNVNFGPQELPTIKGKKE